MSVPRNIANEGHSASTSRTHEAFLQSLRNPDIGQESRLATLRVLIASLPRAAADTPPEDGLDRCCPICNDDMWSYDDLSPPSESPLVLKCCGRFIGQDCIHHWLSPLSVGGGGGSSCPLCRAPLIAPWPSESGLMEVINQGGWTAYRPRALDTWSSNHPELFLVADFRARHSSNTQRQTMRSAEFDVDETSGFSDNERIRDSISPPSEFFSGPSRPRTVNHALARSRSFNG